MMGNAGHHITVEVHCRDSSQLTEITPAKRQGSYRVGLSHSDATPQHKGQPDKWERFWLEAEEVQQLMREEQCNEDELLQRLISSASSLARPPISSFHVGCVGLGASGRLYVGVNLEFPCLPLHNSVHAEQFLVVNAIQHGERELVKLAVSAAPCGHCRQFLSELCCAETVTFAFKGGTYKLADLLPHRFGPMDLIDDPNTPLLLQPQSSNVELTAESQQYVQSRSSDDTFQQAAQAALQQARACYCPYSQCPAGVSIITGSGAIYSGGYIESAAYNPSLPPLQMAIIEGVTDGMPHYTEEDDDLATTSPPAIEINKQRSSSSITALPVTTKLRNELRTSSGSAASTAGTSSSGRSTATTPTSVLPIAMADTGLDPLRGHPEYTKICDLANGASGFVQLCTTKQGRRVAVKFIERGSNSIKLAQRETLNQRLCFGHPYIVQFHEVLLLSDHLAIISEFADGGDLADCIDRHKATHSGKALSENTARWLFQQLVVGVDFCHQMGIANRDIKLENILLVNERNKPVLKLCDFGYSKDEYLESCCKTMCGTPEYVAPEVLLYNRYEGKSADIWSCGVVLYVMLTGGFPFRRKEDEGLNTTKLLQKMFPRIIKADFPRPAELSADCFSLLDAMLNVDTESRITVQGIMQHPWFLTNLPEGMLQLNKRLLQSPANPLESGHFCKQNEDQIQEVCEAALAPPEAAHDVSV